MNAPNPKNARVAGASTPSAGDRAVFSNRWRALDRRYQELLVRRQLGYVQIRSAADATEWSRAEALRESLFGDMKIVLRSSPANGSAAWDLAERRMHDLRELLGAIRRRYDHAPLARSRGGKRREVDEAASNRSADPAQQL